MSQFSQYLLSAIKRYFFVGGLAITIAPAVAQDAQYSQFYANPLHANPALAGSMNRQRAILNYRNQWPAIPRNFINSTVSYDTYYIPWNAGIGVQVGNDRAGLAQSNSFTASYAPRIKVRDKMYAQLGIGAGVIQRSLDFNQLTFGDQYDNNGNINPTSETSTGQNFFFPQLSLGGLLYQKNWYVGLSAFNLINPRVNEVTGGNASRIPVRYSLMTGYRIPLRKERITDAPRIRYNSITPNALLRVQGPSMQLDLGATMALEHILLGAYYRGIPLSDSPSLPFSQDVGSFMVGFYNSFIQIGYSYDVNVNRLRGDGMASHEVSLQYFWPLWKPWPKKVYKPIPCPEI